MKDNIIHGEELISVYSAGRIFGEQELLKMRADDHRRTYTCRALEDSVLLFSTKEEFL